jgi:hypothetical protein
VTILNNGTEPEPLVNVKVLRNGTDISTNSTDNLGPGESRNITITWNTASVAYGNIYNLTAVAENVTGETDLANNVLTDVNIHVKLMGDVNGDKIVELMDFYIAGQNFGNTC